MKIIILIFITIVISLFMIYDIESVPFSMDKQSIDNQSKEIANIVNIPTPTFEMTDIKGNKFSIHDIKEDVILLNFWASWCGSCKKEFPDLVKLINKYKGKVALIAISLDENKKSMQDFANPLIGKNVYFIWDKNKQISMNIFNISKVPETIIINKNRIMIKKIIGTTGWLGNNIKNIINYAMIK